MTSSQHYFLAFSASILGATLLVVGTLVMQDWLRQYGIDAFMMSFPLFIGAYLAIRWYFHTFLPARCPHCTQIRCYPIPGKADRYRCEVCGKDC